MVTVIQMYYDSSISFHYLSHGNNDCVLPWNPSVKWQLCTNEGGPFKLNSPDGCNLSWEGKVGWEENIEQPSWKDWDLRVEILCTLRRRFCKSEVEDRSSWAACATEVQWADLCEPYKAGRLWDGNSLMCKEEFRHIVGIAWLCSGQVLNQLFAMSLIITAIQP